jgi:hypothetical protein
VTLSLADPAVVDPDREEAQKSGGEIAGGSVKIIQPRLDDAETQKIWILRAQKRNDA